MKQFESATAALADLQKRGYVHDLDLHSNFLSCDEINEVISPEEFNVREFYRFEAAAGQENALIYAIESARGTKGILLNINGLYPETPVGELSRKLNLS